MNARLFAATAAAFIAASGPAMAQDNASPEARTEAFAKLPYWPGYWISEQYANTTIGGFAAARPEGSPPLQRTPTQLSSVRLLAQRRVMRSIDGVREPRMLAAR